MTQKLRDLNFKNDGAHVALVSKTLQGGPANQWEVLITKSLKDVTPDLEKAAGDVTVTLTFREFVQKWFGMYYEDAEMLARLLGYSETEESEEVESYSDWIDSKLENISILKSFKDVEDIEKALADLPADQLLQLLKTQESLEPVMADLEKAKGEQMHIEKAQHESLLKAAVDTAVAEVTVTLTKAQEDLTKALSDLVKAQDELTVLKAAQVEAKVAARKEMLVKAVGTAEAEDLMKSLEVLDDTAFATVVKSFENKTAAIQASDLTKELGVGAEGTLDEEDGTTAILRQKFSVK
jgi:hypothetical protein